MTRAFDHDGYDLERDDTRVGVGCYSDTAPGLHGPTTSIVAEPQPSSAAPARPLGGHASGSIPASAAAALSSPLPRAGSLPQPLIRPRRRTP